MDNCTIRTGEPGENPYLDNHRIAHIVDNIPHYDEW